MNRNIEVLHENVLTEIIDGVVNQFRNCKDSSISTIDQNLDLSSTKIFDNIVSKFDNIIRMIKKAELNLIKNYCKFTLLHYFREERRLFRIF